MLHNSSSNEEDLDREEGVKTAGSLPLGRLRTVSSESQESGDWANEEIERVREVSRASMLDVTNVDTLLSGGLGRLFRKMLEQELGYGGRFEVTFENASVRRKVKVRRPASMGAWLRRPVQRILRTATTEDRVVLHPTSGRLPAGSLTLMIGPPKSGKTTLLRLLAGALEPARNNGGKVCINGVRAGQVARKTKVIGVVPQQDEHHALLTVRETLDFARMCHVGVCKGDRLAQLRADLIMRVLGIDHRAETIVGSAAAGIRGVSGGERKRVTIGEALVGRAGVFVMDEYNTGLDQISALEVARAMRKVCDELGSTAVVSMLQPQSDVLDVFDRVLLVAHGGHVVYNGPIDLAEAHFAKVGLHRPSIDVPLMEWLLTDVCGHPQPESLSAHYLAAFTAGDLEHAARSISPASEMDVEALVDAKTLNQQHAQLQQPRGLTPIDLSEKKGFALSKWEDFQVTTARQWKLVTRNRSLNVSLMGEATVLGVLLGTTFLNVSPSELEETDAQLVFGLLFYLSSVLVRQSWQSIPIVMMDRAIFRKQRDLNFHRTWTYTLALSLTQLPVNFAAVLVLSTLVSFLTGVAETFSTYALLTVLLFVLQQALRAWMTFFAAVAPNSNTAQAYAAVFVLISLVFSGFIITVDLIAPWFLPLFWVNPLSWGMRALAQITFSPQSELADELLELFAFSTDRNFILYGALVLLGQFFLFGFVLSGLAFHTSGSSGAYIFQAKPLGPANALGSPRDLEVEVLEVDADTAIRSQDEAEAEANAGKEEDTDTKITIRHKHTGSEEGPASHSHEGQPLAAAAPGATLAVRGLRYSVPVKGGQLELVQGLTAIFPAGSLTALMGESGGGKTTTIDLLAQRKTGGVIHGTILVNGKPVGPAFKPGYVEQFDTQSPTMTVAETVLFSSRLRRAVTMGEESASHEDWCKAQLELLDMEAIRHQRIGGLSIHERKLVAIAQELAADPEIIFLDEPTSGLDAAASLRVVQTLQTVARTGKTVVCTIHQPSTDVFLRFDRLLLLKRGGKLVFTGALGPSASTLVDHLQTVPGTPPLDLGENPATYMLRVLEDNQDGDFVAAFSDSALAHTIAADVEREVRRGEQAVARNSAAGNMASSSSSSSSSFAVVPFSRQLWLCYVRTNQVYFRSPEYTLLRLILSGLLGIFLGGVFFGLGSAEEPSGEEVMSQVGLVYLSMDVIGLLSMVLVIPITFRERDVFYRESAAGFYAKPVHALATVLVEIPHVVASVLLFVGPLYLLVGLESSATSFFLFLAAYVLFILITTFEGLLLSFAMPSAATAQVFVGILTGIWNIYSGFLLPRLAIGDAFIWLYYFNSDTWPLNSLTVSQFANCPATTAQVLADPDAFGTMACALTNRTLSDGTVEEVTVTDFVVDMYNFEPDRMPVDFAVMCSWLMAVVMGVVLSATFVTHIKR